MNDNKSWENMDRFYWFDGNLKSGNEREVGVVKNIRLYDGDDKVSFYFIRITR